MTADLLLADLQQRGVRLAVNGDRLHVDAPVGAVTPEIRQALAANRPELLALLASDTPKDGARPDERELQREGGSSVSGLKGRAVELWSDAAGGRVWIVADEEDALLAKARLGVRRGEIWTGPEIELVASFNDQALAQELAAWKRLHNGVFRPPGEEKEGR